MENRNESTGQNEAVMIDTTNYAVADSVGSEAIQGSGPRGHILSVLNAAVGFARPVQLDAASILTFCLAIGAA